MTAENTNNLYFFAILPPFNIAAELNEIKKEFAEKYGSSKALKSPPHITIIPPFFANDTFEKSIESKVNGFAKDCRHISINLNGFGEFNNKVIFVEMKKNAELQVFYDAFSAFFTGLGFEITSMNKFFHPHVTVAFRDLSAENFKKAWPLFKDREFKDSFSAVSIHLLKHKEDQWQVIKEFSFGG
jgi:2'-5' RNA ligase